MSVSRRLYSAIISLCGVCAAKAIATNYDPGNDKGGASLLRRENTSEQTNTSTDASITQYFHTKEVKQGECPFVYPVERLDGKGQLVPGLVHVQILFVRGMKNQLKDNPDPYVIFFFGDEGKSDGDWGQRWQNIWMPSGETRADLKWRAKTPVIYNQGTTGAWDWSCLMAFNYDVDAKVKFTAQLWDKNTVTDNAMMGEFSKNYHQLLRENGVPSHGNAMYALPVKLKDEFGGGTAHLTVMFKMIRDATLPATFMSR